MRKAAPGGNGEGFGVKSLAPPRYSPANLRSASPSRPWLLHVLSAGSSDVPAAPPGRRKRSEENLGGIRNTEERDRKEFPPVLLPQGAKFHQTLYFLQLKAALTQIGVKPALHHVLPLSPYPHPFVLGIPKKKTKLKSSSSSSEPGKAGRRKRNEHGVGENKPAFSSL